MATHQPQDLREHYDVVVIGGGLGGMTAANVLARAGRSVLLAEQHHKLGGLATWFHRGKSVFDVALHGFPVGMIKSCRRYWTSEIADSIVQLKDIRFDNPMFSLSTTFDRGDFTRLLVERFKVPAANVERFFDAARTMNFYDDQATTAGQLFERFFPGRDDVVRLLMEPITYANGSTLEDPALTYGIVFSNFMSKGVYTFRGGTEHLIRLMQQDLRRSGVDVRTRCPVEKVHVSAAKKVAAVTLDGKRVAASAVISNANLLGTVFNLVGSEQWDADFLEQAKAVRLNNSSTQVYMALKPEMPLEESQCGDLLFSSTAPAFRTEMLLSRDVTSRTYSFYYPQSRPGLDRCIVVASTNANYADWSGLSKDEYKAGKQHLIEDTLRAIEKYVPDIRERLDYVEAATPLTFERYTRHLQGASFGTKFEGLAVSKALPEQIAGLYHTGSVGIIMSGWLGAVNYGVIVANDVDAWLMKGGGG
ncbi:MAG: FAD-dependent oxidoreductase [Planctomycetaceae bacterium]|nr:FAD-dependent oxidoreductase [Planctomycetaceae bacterium]